MKLADLITPETSAGTALFLQWEGYHVFFIPPTGAKPGFRSGTLFWGWGKRQDSTESLVTCALREGQEEIGSVISHLEAATQTYFLRADGSIQSIELLYEGIVPRLILEKRTHSTYGSMAHQDLPYYLVAFDAHLIGKPKPQNEIAALLYLTDPHLSLFHQQANWTIADLVQQGARLEAQTDRSIDASIVLVPHGTARFLVQQARHP